MRSTSRFVPLACVHVVLCGCGLPQQDLDLSPPILLNVAGQPAERLWSAPARVDPSQPLVLDFSEAVDPASVEPGSVVLVPVADLGPCVSAQQCQEMAGMAPSACEAGRCLASQVDEAFLRDASSPPLSKTRQKLVVPAFAEASGTQISVHAVSALEPGVRYDLVVSGGIRDVSGNPLAIPPPAQGAILVPLRTSDPYARCLAARLLRPEAGAAGLPRNLPEVWVALDGDAAAPGAVADQLFLVQAGQVPSRQASFVSGWRVEACPDSRSCLVGTVARDLPPAARLELVAARPPESGPCVAVGEDQAFQTGTEWDEGPPEILDVQWRLVGPCLSVFVSVSEPVTGRVLLKSSLGPGRVVSEASFSMTAASLRASCEWPDLDEALGLFVEVVDPVGWTASWGPEVVEGAGSSARVTITEVLANPAGPEPDQEFVEIWNAGDEPVDLTGWTLATEPGAEEAQRLPAAVLAPGQFGLIVSARYDPLQGSDPTPDPRAALLTLDRPLTGNGMSNGGEAVYLVDAAGRVVAAYDRPLDVSSSKFNGVSAQRLTPSLCGGPEDWAADQAAPPTPGGPNAPWP